MPTTSTIIEGRSPAKTKDQIADALCALAEKVKTSTNNVAYVKSELVNDEFRWKIVEGP